MNVTNLKLLKIKAMKKIFRLTGMMGIMTWCLMTSLSAQGNLDQKPDAIPRARLVWPDVADGTYHIFYSAQDHSGLWSSKIKISHSDQLNLAPTIVTDSHGITWVVWVEVIGTESQLVYSTYDGELWSPPQTIFTGLSSNTGPALAVGSDNIPWLVWAGFDGIDDDIYFSKWNGSDWNQPERVHQDNNVPDILPRLNMSTENTMVLYWDGFESDRYWKFVSIWNGAIWQAKKVASPDLYQDMLEKQNDIIPELPDFVKEPLKASITIQYKEPFQSFKLRELKIK